MPRSSAPLPLPLPLPLPVSVTLPIEYGTPLRLLIAEPAAAIGIGALLAGAIKIRPDEKVCVVLTGENWDLCDLAEIYKMLE